MFISPVIGDLLFDGYVPSGLTLTIIPLLAPKSKEIQHVSAVFPYFFSLYFLLYSGSFY